LFTILVKKCKTPAARDILSRLRYEKDGRKALQQILQEYYESTTADLLAEDLYSKIVNASIGSDVDCVHEEIVKLETLIDEYNETVRYHEERINDTSRRTFLERAVAGISALSQIKTRERDRIAIKGIRARFTTPQYVYALKEAAKQYDGQRMRRRRRNRLANMHIHEESSLAIDEQASSDDTPWDQSMYQAYVANSSEGSRIANDIWQGMDSAGKRAWTQIPAKDRAAILSGKPLTRKVNFADMNDVKSESDDDDEEASTQEEQAAETREANNTETSTKGKAHPADVRRVMAQPKKKPAPTPKRSNFKATWIAGSVRRVNSATTAEGTATVPDNGDSELDAWGASEPDDVSRYMDQVDDYWGDQQDQYF